MIDSHHAGPKAAKRSILSSVKLGQTVSFRAQPTVLRWKADLAIMPKVYDPVLLWISLDDATGTVASDASSLEGKARVKGRIHEG